MSKPFDATLNELIDLQPQDWVKELCRRLEIPEAPFQVMDTDLSTTMQADKLFRLEGPNPAVLHVEFESKGRIGHPAEMLRYNAVTHLNLNLPVYSILFLLRPKANTRDATGLYEVPGPKRRAYLTFEYLVVRVWQESADTFLRAGLGLAPLAMITNEASQDLSGTFARVQERLRQPDVSVKLREQLLSSTFVLSGLRHSDETLIDLYRSISMLMEDSSTYQWILRKGEAQGIEIGIERGIERGQELGKRIEAKDILRLFGQEKFGTLPLEVNNRLLDIHDLARLHRMLLKIHKVASWDELLAVE